MTKPVKRPHKKPGRALKTPPASVPTAVMIEALAADGRSVIGVAAAFGTSKEVLARWMEKDPELLEAFERGREKERHNLHNKLYRQGISGIWQCSMFLLKARHGYREGDQSDAANKVSITFALPGALKPEQFLRVVHEQTADSDKPISTKRLSRS